MSKNSLGLKAIVRSRAARNRILAALVLTVIVVFGNLPAWIFAGFVLVVWAIVERREIARALPLGWIRDRLLRANGALSAGIEAADRSLRDKTILRTVYRIAAVTWVGLCFGYVFSARPPYEFFADIGGYINALGRMGAVATSPGAIATMLGWQTWNDAPNFVLFPNGTLYAALPIELLLRDPFRAIKLVQAVQLTAAFLGAAWLYSLLFGKSRWCWLAGWIYAAMPFTTLAVRGESDFGSIFACVPLALACAIQLARRFGARGLPLAALVCGVVGGAFYSEYLVTLGVPLLIATYFLFRREGVRVGFASFCGAVLAFALFPAYIVLPTLLGPHPLWFTDSYQAGLANRTNLPTFSEGLFDLLAGISRENLLADNPLLNATPSVPFALLSGFIAWIFAAVALARAWFSGSRWWWPIAVVALACAIVSFGPSFPFVGASIWNIIAATPILNALRTPDRFAHFDAILLALAATYGFAFLARKLVNWRPALGVLCVVLVLGYAIFDIQQSVLGFGTMDWQLPNQTEVSKLTKSIQGRTAVLAVTRGGSAFDVPPYAPLNPTVSYAWDLAAKYSDTDAGVALLRRAAVRSIVTTPVWALNVPAGMPDNMATPIARSAAVRVTAPFPTPLLYGVSHVSLPESARVFEVQTPRDMLSQVVPVCTFAGPAAFELAAGSAWFDGAALIHGTHNGCSANLYADYDPLDDAIPQVALATWAGTDVFGAGADLPASSSFEVDRLSLMAPWYRRSYAGDSLLSKAPFSTVGPSTSRSVSYVVTQPGRYDVYARVAGLGVLVTIGADGQVVEADSERSAGFNWVRLPLGELGAGTHILRLQTSRPGQPAGPMVIDEIAVAPESFVPATARTDGAVLSIRAFFPPLRSSDRRLNWIFPRLQYGEPTSLGQGAEIDGQTTVGTFDGAAQVRSSSSSTRIRFRWSGATGRYVGGVAAWLPGDRGGVAVTSGERTFSAARDASQGAAPISAYGTLDLVHGGPIDVTMSAPSAGPQSPSQLLDLVFVPVVANETPTDYDGASEAWHFDSGNTVAFFEAVHGSGVSLNANALVSGSGGHGVLRFRPDFYGGIVNARVDGAGTLASAELACGGAISRADFGSSTVNPGGADLSVNRSKDAPCELRLAWRSADASIKSIVLRAEGRTLLGWRTSQYLTAGNYELAGSGRGAAILVDGMVMRAGRAVRLSNGRHLFVLLRASNRQEPIFIRSVDTWMRPSSGSGTTLELAQLSDGYWTAKAGQGESQGYSCDLVNTCFDGVARDGASVRHMLPSWLAAGLLVTAIDALVCIALLQIRSRKMVRP